MPIYEFYCPDCHMIFNFFSRMIDTTTCPTCPHCRRPRIERRMSTFAFSKGRSEDEVVGLLDVDESRMQRAMELLSSEADRIDENDPKQATDFIKKLARTAGLPLNDKMEEALARLEAGANPDELEAEMGDLFGDDGGPAFPESKGPRRRTLPPAKDETLYDL